MRMNDIRANIAPLKSCIFIMHRFVLEISIVFLFNSSLIILLVFHIINKCQEEYFCVKKVMGLLAALSADKVLRQGLSVMPCRQGNNQRKRQ